MWMRRGRSSGCHRSFAPDTRRNTLLRCGNLRSHMSVYAPSGFPRAPCLARVSEPKFASDTRRIAVSGLRFAAGHVRLCTLPSQSRAFLALLASPNRNSLRVFTQISRKGAAICRDLREHRCPPVSRDSVFPSALVETAPALQRFADRQSASAAVLFLLFPKNLGRCPAIFGSPFKLGLRIIEIAHIHPFS